MTIVQIEVSSEDTDAFVCRTTGGPGITMKRLDEKNIKDIAPFFNST